MEDTTGVNQGLLMTQIRPAAHALVRMVQGEAVVLDLRSERYLGLNEVGTRIWELATAADRVADILPALLAEFDVDEIVLRRDVEAFIAALVDAGLAVVCEPPTSEPASPGYR
jgi:hypothetical protein